MPRRGLVPGLKKAGRQGRNLEVSGNTTRTEKWGSAPDLDDVTEALGRTCHMVLLTLLFTCNLVSKVQL